MKKIYLSLFLLVLNAWAFGQRFQTYQGRPCYGTTGLQATLKAQNYLDTLNFHVGRASGFSIPGVQAGGYLFGVSDDGQGASITDATGMYFDSMGTANVAEVYVWVGAKHIMNSPDMLKCEVYNAGPDSLPTNLLGYGSFNMGFIDSSVSVNFGTGLGLNRFTIDNGVSTVTSSFVVAINYQSFDDTVGLVSNNAGDGFGERRAKQMMGVNFGGGWASAADIWQGGSDQDPMIIPILEFSGSVGTAPPAFGNKDLSLVPAWPNPANASTTLAFTTGMNTQGRVAIWDVSGRVVYDSGSMVLDAGEHRFEFDLSQLPAGPYNYTITTRESQISSRLTVVH